MKMPSKLTNGATRIKNLSKPKKILITACILMWVLAAAIIFMPNRTIASPRFEGVYRIKSNHSSKYIQIADESLTSGAEVKLSSSNGLGQLFVIEELDDDYVKIINVNSLMVLDLTGNNNIQNQAVIQYDDKNSENQHFGFEKLEDGSYNIMVRHSGQYLTIKDDSTQEDAMLVQYPLKSEVKSQVWTLEKVTTFDTLDDYLMYKFVHTGDTNVERVVQGAKLLGFTEEENAIQQAYKAIMADQTPPEQEEPTNSELDDFLEKRVIQDRELKTSTLLNEAKDKGLQADEETIKQKVDELLKAHSSEIFSDSTGFITTFGMLNVPLDQIGFAGAHNAFSNNQDRRSSFAWDTYKTGHSLGTENHNISIKTMLEKGYRVIDLDIGDNGNGNTGCYHRYRLSGYSNLNGKNAILPKIKSFLDEHPNEIAIIHISDVYNGTIDLFKLKNRSLYHPGEAGYDKQFSNMYQDMQDTGLLGMTYNYHGNSGTSRDDRLKYMRTPGKDIPWPTVNQMIQSNKRLLFVVRDTGVAKDIRFKNQDGDPNKTTAANLNITQAVLDDFKSGSANKLINITCTEDWGASAGDIEAAKINNNGRRIYEIVKKANTALKGDGINKVANVLYVDYATGNKKQGGWIDVSPVDAMNRANYDKQGYPWTQENAGQWYWD